MSNFRTFYLVGRGSETQVKMGENFDYSIFNLFLSFNLFQRDDRL